MIWDGIQFLTTVDVSVTVYLHESSSSLMHSVQICV